ncbi:carbon-phosphorus lyase complex subunit PhnI [Paraphotobacterium marinum]|uniref:carbon-phosphorus lyase complex subunit PhnI n=1 Tax=Paraphotobacterium marinum TaxID=1755811 RepID=UPI0039E9EE69
MYVAVKGGEKAIESAHELQNKKRRGPLATPELSVKQIQYQLSGSVDRVMTEGGIYDPELAALSIKQASGDLVEAIFLLRAYRTTLPRFVTSKPLETNKMVIQRRISAIYKDIPGGQVLGPTYDYTHRLLDFSLLAEGSDNEEKTNKKEENPSFSEEDNYSQVTSMLEEENLLVMEKNTDCIASDLTMNPISFPCDRSAKLQQLVRGDEGFLLGMGYSTQRGYGDNHPFVGEIRIGNVSVSVFSEELGFEIEVGEIEISECQLINGFTGDKNQRAKLTRGYGLAYGHNERKTISIALVDRALQSKEYNEAVESPAQDEEFVLSHADNVEASGFLSHLKLPHYVDFQADINLLRQMQKDFDNNQQSIERKSND